MKTSQNILAAIFVACVLSIFVGLFNNNSNKSMVSSDGDSSNNSQILVVNIEGMIKTELSREKFKFTDGSYSRALRQLQNAYYNDSIKAVLLRINSPGGTVGASQEMYRAIERLRKKNVYVVSTFSDIGASGAYYIASASNYIYANRGSLVGSIGVIMNGFNIEDLMNRYGIKKQVIKSGKYKDIFAYWRPQTNEEKQILQELSDEIHTQFISDIEKYRGDKIKNLKLLAQGQIYSGEKAVSLGLIDAIGGRIEALEHISKVTGIKIDPSTIKEKSTIFDKFISEFNLKTKSNLFDLFLNNVEVR